MSFQFCDDIYTFADFTTVVWSILLVFSVTPFKIDENKNEDLSIDKVQNLGNERRYI